ncbi:hypothetical protein ACH4RG_34985 [Streptomyces sp. NPDC021019]|uniref:hypothetical protein n=1 Tax=Streptomyces sp. NPDC021019 TaxID=3365108 RepID=UPI0037ACE626
MEARMWNGLVGVAKETYTASLGEGVVPRPLMMPLVRGELVGLIWVRPLKVGQDALAGIAELANICRGGRGGRGRPRLGDARRRHRLRAADRRPGTVPDHGARHPGRARPAPVPLHRAAPVSQPRGLGVGRPRLEAGPAPQPGGELVPPTQAAVNFSFTPVELDLPDPFGVTVVLMEEDGYRISLTEAFAR